MQQPENGTPAAPPSEEGMAQALEDYLAAVAAGTAPPREQASRSSANSGWRARN
jgi:hypothetical protein